MAREEVIKAVQAFKVRTRHMNASDNWQLAKNLMNALESYYGKSVIQGDDLVKNRCTNHFYQTLSFPEGTVYGLKERIREAYGEEEWLFNLLEQD